MTNTAAAYWRRREAYLPDVRARISRLAQTDHGRLQPGLQRLGAIFATVNGTARTGPIDTFRSLGPSNGPATAILPDVGRQ